MIGQNERPVKRPVFLLLLCLILLMYVLWAKRHEIIPEQDITPQIALKRDSVKEKDSIYYEDKKILDKLCPILRKREGFRSRPYPEGNHFLIGFGHYILKNEHFTEITISYADSLLREDILRAYEENERIKRKTLYQDVKNIFISGEK